MSQDTRINSAQRVAVHANLKSEATKQDAHELRLKLDRLEMLCEALWLLLKQSQDLKDEDLRAIIKSIDLRDGKLDNRVAPCGPQYCKKCGKALQKASPVCIFCGHEKDPGVFPV